MRGSINERDSYAGAGRSRGRHLPLAERLQLSRRGPLGALVSNVGTWMQRTAQDWIVLTQLTHNNATAVGVVMALQFGPQVLLLPLTGFAADHFDRRKLLFATQATMGALALGLGILTVARVVQLWHVYVFAFLLGCVTAFDAPARQTFVSELVVEADLSNAVALNSTSFNAARMIGPAIAGVLIASVGSGWVFLINAVSFAAVLWSLSLLRGGELHPRKRAARTRGSLAEGFRYVWKRPDLKAVLFMFLLIGTFGLNFPIFISTMSVTVFHQGAGQYGLSTSIMAIGSVAGALFSARQARPRMALLLVGAAIFGVGLALAAIMPSYGLFGLALVLVGLVGADLHHLGERHGPALDRARHARARGRDPAGDRARRHADRRAHRRLGRRHVRAALGVARRRRRRIRRRDRRHRLPGEVPQPARAFR